MPRLKSEAIVRAQCDAGLAAYLAEIHKKDLTSSAGTGIFLGTIISGSIWGVSKVLNEKFGLLEYSSLWANRQPSQQSTLGAQIGNFFSVSRSLLLCQGNVLLLCYGYGSEICVD